MLGTEGLHERARSGKELPALWTWIPQEKRRGKHPSYPPGLHVIVVVAGKPGKMKKKIKRTSLMVLIVFSYHLLHPLFLTLAHAQSLGSISGKVTDAATGEPLGDILVMAVLKDGNEATLETARTYIKDGTYTITDLPEGTYQVFIGSNENNVASQKPVEVVVPQGVEIQNVDFQVQAGTSLEGRILASDGVTPVANAGIVFSFGADLRVVRADETGKYSIHGLSQNQTYKLFASREGEAGVVMEVTTLSAKQTLQNMDIVLPNPQTGVKGNVTAQGEPVSDAIVRVKGAESMGYAKTDSQGNFQITGLKEGTYTVVVEKEGFNIAADFEVQVVNGQQTIKEFSLVVVGTESGNSEPGLKTRNLAMQELFGNNTVVASIGPMIFASPGAEANVLVREFPKWAWPFVWPWLITEGHIILSVTLFVILFGCLTLEMVRVEYKDEPPKCKFWASMKGTGTDETGVLYPFKKCLFVCDPDQAVCHKLVHPSKLCEPYIELRSNLTCLSL